MKHFEEGLPNQFILFSQTPKAQEHGRTLFCSKPITPNDGIGF